MKSIVCASLLFCACAHYDVVLRNGTIYDGSGGAPYKGDIAIKNDRIAKVGTIGGHAKQEIDASGKAIAPGFINMLSWATTSLIADGRGMADVKQGVTLEIFGEGWSEGPLSEALKAQVTKEQGDIKYDVTWTTLREYLDSLVQRGISVNVASFIGATTVRMHVLGEVDRAPTPAELEQMRALVRQAMEDGALGVGSSLIYAPAFYAKTDELIELNKAAAPYGGMYISHMRSEGNRLEEAVDELITIAREAGVPAEIYHLKAAGQANWPKMAKILDKIEAARAEGLRITADMYTYTAGATGLDAAMPPWVQEGGYDAWRARLLDPATRAKVITEMRTPTNAWENLLLLAGSPDRVRLIGFKNEKLKPLTGKTLAEVAAMRGVSAEDAAIDLVIEDGSRVATVYFLMSDDNLKLQMRKPWVSFGSDAGASAPEGVFLKSSTHPREYGNFANLLGHYVRDEQVLPLEEAVRRLTWLPAKNLDIADRGLLKEGYFADVVVFDPSTIAAPATYDNPRQYASGVEQVFVNGTQVLKAGEHTNAKPGRALTKAHALRQSAIATVP